MEFNIEDCMKIFGERTEIGDEALNENHYLRNIKK